MRPLSSETTFITYHDGSEPYLSMADRLCQSIREARAGIPMCFEVHAHGGYLFAELMGQAYNTFSQAIQSGKVVLLDADCIVNAPLDFPREDFDLAAVYRGKCSNSMGDLGYLSTLVAFGDKDPNVSRQLWFSWGEAIIACAETHSPVRGAEVRNKRLQEKGFKANWFSDEAALNGIIALCEDMRKSCVAKITALHRDKFAADPGTEGAYVTHYKGSNKIK